MKRIIGAVLICGLVIGACRSDDRPETKSKTPAEGEQTMAITVTSTAFQEGGLIPPKYTCDGKDISPPLAFAGVPTEARSLALICDDPDAPRGTWVHWVLFNLPASVKELPESVSDKETIEGGARQGTSDFGRFGYGGPCPPGGTHRYYFRVYALDTMLTLTGRGTKADLMAAMKGHILAEGQLMGKYRRQ